MRGKVLIGNNTAFGTGTVTLAGGTTIAVDATTARTVANAWSASGNITIGKSTDTAVLTLSGAGTLTGNTTFTSASGNAVSQQISGVISDGAGSFSITKEGASSLLALNGANTYDGGTIINGGRLQAGNAASYGTGGVTVNNGGQAYLTGTGTYANTFTLAGNGHLDTGNGNLGALRYSANTTSGTLTLAADSRITAYGSSGTISGTITETGSARVLELGGTFVTATSGGTLTVSGTNTYTGGTLITNAIVNANSNAAFGTGPITLTGPTATGRIVLANGVNVANSLSSGTNVGATGLGVLEVTATNATATWSGPISITSGVGGGGHFYTDATSTLTLSGALTSTSTVAQRAGNVVYAGGGSYATLGITGTAKVGATNGIATNAEVQLGVSSNANLDLNGFNQSVSSVTRTANSTFVLNNGATPSTLTVNYSGVSPSTFNGVMQDGTSTLSLTKSGSGTYVLAGANTYTGTTTISGGTLLLGGGTTAGSIAAASAIVDNASLAFNFTNAQSIPNAISGSGGVTQSGTGTTTLAGAFSYTGDTTVSAGSLSVTAATFADGADIKMTTGAVLNLNHALTDTVRNLYLDGVAQTPGTYGSLTSSATNKVAYITGTGILNVVGLTGYTSWAATNAGGGAATADYDKDGMPNGVEYFMGQTGSSFTPNPAIINGKVTWPKDPAALATGIVETSPDLSVWTTATGVVDNGTTLEYTLPNTDPKLFVRLRVTVP